MHGTELAELEISAFAGAVLVGSFRVEQLHGYGLGAFVAETVRELGVSERAGQRTGVAVAALVGLASLREEPVVAGTEGVLGPGRFEASSVDPVSQVLAPHIHVGVHAIHAVGVDQIQGSVGVHGLTPLHPYG